MANALKIGWIGTGVMGQHMCRHILKGGYNLQVFSRTASKADNLLELGATFTEPRQLAQNVDILCMMLGFPQDVERMTLSHDHGLLKYMKPGSLLIDHTTSSPGLSQ